MFGIKCITNGDTSPRGKQKIWIAMHPFDYNTDAFNSIVDSVLRKHINCAVYFEDFSCEHKNKKEIISVMSQAQLIILIVSKKTLTTSNNAIDFEFKYAVANNITVLPIVIEKNLERLFAKKCGSIQYLEQNNEDLSVVSYDEKLTKFLSSILLGDDEIKLIKNAFDAKIFLSYRKKDRVCAQKLMRIIHENELFRDVAIWYDEYLIPSEKFDLQIEKELKESDVFVLSISPTITSKTMDEKGNECDNFVVKEEYPMAQKLNIPIIAATTDSKKIKKIELNVFADVLPCVDAQKREELYALLVEKIKVSSKCKRIKLRDKDSDPTHIFLIGLAYLNGINVEQNHQRAINLITQAANYGLIEAMRKLIFCYHNGSGIERNYLTEIFWQEKLTECLRKKYNQSKCEKDAFDFGCELLKLGDDYRELKYENDKAEDVYNRFAEFCRKERNLQKSINIKRLLSASLMKIGFINYAKHNYNDAQKNIDEAFKISENIYALLPKEKCVQEELAVMYFWKGLVASRKGDLEKAKEYFLRDVSIRKAVDKTTTTREDILVEGASYRELFLIAEKQGNEKFSNMYISKCVETIESLLKIKTEESLADCLVSNAHRCAINNRYSMAAQFYLLSAESCLESSDDANAKKYYDKSFSFIDKIRETKNGIERLRDIGNIYISQNKYLIKKAEYCFMGLRVLLKFCEFFRRKCTNRKEEYGNMSDFLSDCVKMSGRRFSLEKFLKQKGILDKTAQTAIKKSPNEIIKMGKRFVIWKRHFRKTEKFLLKIVRKSKQEVDENVLGEFYREVAYKTTSRIFQIKTAKKGLNIFQRLKNQHPQNDKYVRYVTELKKLLQ